MAIEKMQGEISELDAMRMMLVEARNELTKSKIVERMHTRMSLAGNQPNRAEQGLAIEKAKQKALKDSMDALESFIEAEMKKLPTSAEL